MWSTLKNALTSFLLLIALCVGANAAMPENRTLGDFAATQHYADQNPQANRLATLESFGFFQKRASECCNATNNGAIPDGWRPVSGLSAQVNTPRGFSSYRTPDRDLVHVSPGGLKYGADPKFGNRVDHVLDHTAPNPKKPVHTVFNAQGDDALDLVDQAWARRGAPDPSDPAAFVVNMGRPIGTAGETSIRIVVRPGTTEVITAYPY